MTHHKVQIRLGMDSGIPNDAVVNTWHCNVLTPVTGYQDFVDDLLDFYHTIDLWLSPAIDPAACTYKVYNMTDDEPRAPVAEGAFTGITPASTASPPELAICFSFQGTRLSGQSQARRRGRVYIGPLTNVWASTTNPQIGDSVLESFQTAGQALVTASEASTTYEWVVYSERDADLVAVHSGWVDNAIDIQRRRGLAATKRLTFTGP